MDERSILHRYKATRLAVAAGMLTILGWFNYEAFVNDIMRWDYIVILSMMLVVKLAARLYYKFTN